MNLDIPTWKFYLPPSKAKCIQFRTRRLLRIFDHEPVWIELERIAIGFWIMKDSPILGMLECYTCKTIQSSSYQIFPITDVPAD